MISELSGKAFGYKGEFVAVAVTLTTLLAPLIILLGLTGQFIKESLKVLLNVVSDSWVYSSRVFIIFCALAALLLCVPRNMRLLGFANLAALVCIVFLVFLIFVDFFIDAMDPAIDSPQIDLAKWSMSGLESFVTIVFAYSSHTTLLPILSGSTPGRKNLHTMIFIAQIIGFILFSIAGIFGYLHFGNEVRANILKSKEITSYAVAALFLAISNILSYPLVVIPTKNGIIWILSQMTKRNLKSKSADLAITASIIVLASLIAFFVRDLRRFYNLIGSIAGSFILMILPASLFFMLADRRKRVENIAMILVFLLGLIILFGGTISAIYGWFS